MAKPSAKTALTIPELTEPTSLIVKIKSMSVMTIALSLSVLLHIVILSIHFKPELKKLRNKLQVLDVVLVNTKTKARPEKADVYAQANLDRGGNTDLDRQMKTALPALTQQKTEVTLKPVVNAKQSAKAAESQAEEMQAQKNVAALEKQAQALMTQLEAKYTVETQPVQKAKATEVDTAPQESQSKKINMQDMSALALQIDRLEAQISKQQEDYQKRPKKKFLGGRAKEYSHALYEEAWRQKVEKIGNLNYPEAAKNLKLYGQLQMTVSIKADGSIEEVVINRSSGHKVLDAAAIRIVELGAPYARFPDDIHKEADILDITKTWTFTKEDSLATE